MSEKEILNEIIVGYRKVIKDRYQYKKIQSTYNLPSYLDKNRINTFRDYFLDSIYPDLKKRKELDEAFQSLDNYIKHPEKLIRLLLDSSRLLFKYGRHLPKIMKAGIKALKSFRTATKFEQQLVQAALANPMPPPYSIVDINTLIKSLSPKAINQFIDNNKSLFGIMKDRKLVHKIIEIVTYLISKMEESPAVYSAEEIKGLEIGRDIIVKGSQLFDQLSQKELDEVLEFAIQLETDSLNQIFAEA